jgi:DNA-binding transcriptional LysR family regulator
MINQTDLKYFLELSKTLHMSRAAERLGISQPTLSHCLKKIENETGIVLFTRTKKGVTLTQAGQRVFEKAEDLIQKWNEVLSSAKSENEEVAGMIRLGCHTAVAQYTLPKILPQFLKDNPAVNLQLQHGLSRHINEAVISDRLDIGVVVNPSPHPDLIIKEMTKDRVTIWKSVNLKNSDVLIYDPSLLQSQDLLKKLQKKGISFKRLIESSSLEVISQMVVAGAGCGILPERVIQAFNADHISALKDAPSFQDRICLVFKPEFRKLKRGQVLIESFSHFNG